MTRKLACNLGVVAVVLVIMMMVMVVVVVVVVMTKMVMVSVSYKASQHCRTDAIMNNDDADKTR